LAANEIDFTGAPSVRGELWAAGALRQGGFVVIPQARSAAPTPGLRIRIDDEEAFVELATLQMAESEAKRLKKEREQQLRNPRIGIPRRTTYPL
jgi:hypothetical protein